MYLFGDKVLLGKSPLYRQRKPLLQVLRTGFRITAPNQHRMPAGGLIPMTPIIGKSVSGEDQIGKNPARVGFLKEGLISEISGDKDIFHTGLQMQAGGKNGDLRIQPKVQNIRYSPTKIGR